MEELRMTRLRLLERGHVKSFSILLLLQFFSLTILSTPSYSSKRTDLPAVTEKLIASDIKQIKRELPDFQRPDFKEIPYLIQRVSLDQGITEYLFPPVEAGQEVAQVAFSRKSIDTHLSVLVFPTGLNEFSKPIERKYVVLRRHSKQTPVYFLSFVYVRQSGVEKVIEWEVEELSHHAEKTEIEREICRGEDCDVPEWILGTCQVIQHNCSIKLKKPEVDTILRRLKMEEQEEDSMESLNFGDDSNSGSTSSEEEGNLRRRKKRSENNNNFMSDHNSNSSDYVPSSLDLLFLRVPNAISDTNTKSNTNDDNPGKLGLEAALKQKHSTAFAYEEEAEEEEGQVFDKKKRSLIDVEHNIEEILHILKCRDCQKLGNFYSDLEEEVSFNRILGEKLKIQYNNTKPKHTKRFPWMKKTKNKPYVGYGECAYMMEQPNLRKPMSKEMDDVIDFYLETLHLDCNNNLKNEIRSWLTSKTRFVRIVQDLSFEFIPNAKLLQYKMLTAQEFETIVSALLFIKYSTVYREESNSKPPSRLKLLGHPLSSRVSFLTRVFLKVIDTINKYLKQHVIKVTRALSRILKGKFYALLVAKNYIHLKKTSKQAHQHKENYRDRIQIMALKEFILYGLSPIFRSGTSTDVAFKSFYQLNENRIRFLVHTYGFDSTKNP